LPGLPLALLAKTKQGNSIWWSTTETRACYIESPVPRDLHPHLRLRLHLHLCSHLHLHLHLHLRRRPHLLQRLQLPALQLQLRGLLQRPGVYPSPDLVRLRTLARARRDLVGRAARDSCSPLRACPPWRVSRRFGMSCLGRGTATQRRDYSPRRYRCIALGLGGSASPENASPARTDDKRIRQRRIC